MNVFFQSSYVEILTPRGDAIRRWSFGRYLGHEDDTLINGISAFMKEAPDRGPLPPPSRESVVRRYQL